MMHYIREGLDVYYRAAAWATIIIGDATSEKKLIRVDGWACLSGLVSGYKVLAFCLTTADYE